MEASGSNLLDFLLSRRGLMSASWNFEFAIQLFKNWCLKIQFLFYFLFRVLWVLFALLRFRSFEWLLLFDRLWISVFFWWDPHITLLKILNGLTIGIWWLSCLLFVWRLFFFSCPKRQIRPKILCSWLVAYYSWLSSRWMDLSCYYKRLKTFYVFLKFETFTFITPVR